MKRKTGVLIHGYNVHSKNWQEVVWWKSPELVGRLPQGAKVILEAEPEMVIFGTGASERDGKIEAEVMRDYLLEHIPELELLTDFRGINLKKLRDRISQISRLETKSKNTYEEILHASYIFRQEEIERIIMVSSPDHTPRCGLYAAQIYYKEKELNCYLGNFYIYPSMVPYGTSIEDVVIKESPIKEVKKL